MLWYHTHIGYQRTGTPRTPILAPPIQAETNEKHFDISVISGSHTADYEGY
jgi:hypothetical protein